MITLEQAIMTCILLGPIYLVGTVAATAAVLKNARRSPKH